MKAKNHCLIVSGAATALYVTILSTSAAVIQKPDNATELYPSGGIVPGSAEIASWDSTLTLANTASLGGNPSYCGARIASLGWAASGNLFGRLKATE